MSNVEKGLFCHMRTEIVQAGQPLPLHIDLESLWFIIQYSLKGPSGMDSSFHFSFVNLVCRLDTTDNFEIVSFHFHLSSTGEAKTSIDSARPNA